MSSVRNKDGIWINSSVFSESANHFMKYGYYCPDPDNSIDWFNFWQEERKRCVSGYSVSGVSIPGDYYFYLNYCMINATLSTSDTVSRKIQKFPDFWDGDYNYFWVREIARKGVLKTSNLSLEKQDEIYNLSPNIREKELVKLLDDIGLYYNIVPSLEKGDIRIENLLGGKDLVVLKARRKGFSFKNASIAVNNFFNIPDSYTMLMGYDKKYLFPKGIFGMCMSYINFINKNTAWRTPADYVKKQDHIRNSYKSYKEGTEIEEGFMSEIQAISFKDNPQAGVGKDCYDIMGEEVGVWGVPGGLIETMSSMLPSIGDGVVKTGMATLFGTANDVAKGTVDFADMYNRPESYTFLSFYDIFGQQENSKKGFFFPIQMNLVGYYDKQGNSDLKGASEYELNERKKLTVAGTSSQKMLLRIREFPLTGNEALNFISYNSFPIVELQRQLDNVISNDLQTLKGTPVIMSYDGENVTAIPVLDGSLEPIISYKSLPLNLNGCPVIYEYPIVNAPRGLYKIGYDPVRQDTGTSLAALIVYKGVHIHSQYHSIIVAEYIGRLESTEDMDRIAEMFADFYNTQIMYENEVTGVKNFFRRIKRLNLLASQPDLVISKNVKRSRVSRIYGCHMSRQLKDGGERYVKDWLLSVLDYDENGDKIRVIDKIYSIRLLEELINYNREGNFDLISALFMCMFQVQEEELGKKYDNDDKPDDTGKKLVNMINNLYIK